MPSPASTPGRRGRRRPPGMAVALLVLTLSLALSPGATRAGDGDDPTEQEVAAAVLKAFEAGQEAKLAELAARKKPDPWLVADHLLAEGHAEAAERFAAAEPRPATRGLVAYVRSRRDKPTAAMARSALAAARAALDQGDFERMQAALKDVDAGDGSAVAAQILFARGIAEHSLRHLEAASATLEAARKAAHAIGWLNLESYVLDWASSVATALHDRPRALALARARVELETAWGRRTELTAALGDLAMALRRIGEAREARLVMERALELTDDDEASLERTELLVATAAAAMDMDDMDAALRYTRRALGIARRTRNAEAMALALTNLGGVYFDMGEVERSRTSLEQGLKLARREELRQIEFEARGHLADLYAYTGDYPRALTAYRRLLEAVGDGKSERRRAFLLNNLAALRMKLGDAAGARTLLRESLSLFEELRFAPGIAATATSLGELAMGEGDMEAAAVLLKRAHEVHLGEGHRRRAASTLASLATLASHAGRGAEAVTLYRRALAILDEVGFGRSAPTVRSHLGYVLVAQGETKEGIALMERAVAEAHASRGPDVHARVLARLARAWLEAGHPEKAALRAQQALDQMEFFLGGLGEEESVTTRRRHSEVYEVGAVAAVQLGDAAKALRFLEAGRAGSLLESLGGRDALQWADLPVELLEAEKKARLAQAAAAAALREAARGDDLDAQRAARAELDRTTADVRVTISRIQREAKAQAGLYYPRPARLRRIQRLLRGNEALVVYGLCLNGALAVVVRSKEVRLCLLGDRTPIEKACAVYRTLDADVKLEETERTLKKLLVEPLKLPPEVEHVVISPVEALCYVPMSTLFEVTTSLTPSATTMALLRTEGMSRGRGVLALGDPAYGASAESAPSVYVRSGLVPLPATRLEVETIGTVVLTGEEATESGFRKAVSSRRQWRAVHFACHGRVDHENPTLCALALTPSDEDDGFLSALEVLRLRIPADLAILSACETGRGRVVKGEGLVGLVRAFMYAGTPRVIASLWKVDDEATQALMLKFYELWRGENGKGLDAATALRRAQAHVRSKKKWAHPYYWSAWVLWGSSE